MDGFQLSVLKDKLSRDISVLQIRINETEVELSEVQKGLLEVEDKLLLENVGVYEYQHVLEIAVEYQEKLKAIRDKIKGMVKQNKATVVGNTLTINGSDKDGSATPEEVQSVESKIEELSESLEQVNSQEANQKAGYVYVISNIGSFGKDVVKIGMTRRLEPMDRIKELGDASVPFSFDVHALVFSEDAISLENTLHRVFFFMCINMVNLRKEFFYVAPHEVKEELVKLDEKYLLDFVEEPVAEEWYRSVPLHNHNTWVKEDEVCARINTNDSNFPNAPIYKTTTGYEIRFDGKIVAIPADKYEIIISSGMGFRVQRYLYLIN